MAGPTKEELAGELARRVMELEKLLAQLQLLLELKTRLLESQMAERIQTEQQNQQKLLEMTVKQAAADERGRQLERNSDRTWQVWLALLVAGVSLLMNILNLKK